MNDRYEHITERLVAIEEELRDLAYENLREVARSPDSDDGIVAAKQEKRLLQARRAIAKAIGALAPVNTDD
jgi:phage terminase large subunit-like protein